MKIRFPMLAILAAACGSSPLEQLGTGERLGIIKYEDHPVVVNVPGTAEVGEPLTVSVVSWGVEVCLRKGRTSVTESGSLAVVVVIDSMPQLPPGSVCILRIDRFDHEATIVFSEAGRAIVEIRGREWPSNEPYNVRRRVLVH